MAYATLQDLIDRYGEAEVELVADRDGNGAVDTDAVDRAIADAGALIDSYVGRRYRTPIDPVAPVIVPVACALAWHALMAVPTDAVIEARKAAIKWLERVADGKAEIAGADGIEAATDDSSAAILVDAPDRVFSRDTLRGF